MPYVQKRKDCEYEVLRTLCCAFVFFGMPCDAIYGHRFHSVIPLRFTLTHGFFNLNRWTDTAVKTIRPSKSSASHRISSEDGEKSLKSRVDGKSHNSRDCQLDFSM